MQITRKDLENSIVELTIETSTENVASNRAKVIKQISESADIKGFRKWAKIPENVIVKHYWEDYINNKTIDFAIDSVYSKALYQEKLVPVAQWEITEVISQSPLKFKLQIEVLPIVEISDEYKNIKLKKQSIEVKDSEVEAALKDIQTRFTKYEEVTNEKIALGDKVTIDTDWYDLKWEILENTSMRDFELVLGQNILVPGFEDDMVWASLWEELNLDVSFPKDYHNADFAGLKTKFSVKIKKIQKAKLPEFTPEFIKDLRGKELDLAWFKELIKTEIFDTKMSNARLEDEIKLIDELLKVSKLSIWKNLLKGQIDKIFAEIKENMAAQNIKMRDYLESLKLTEEQYKENLAPDATKRLQGELILNKLMEIEKIEASEDEISAEIERIKWNYSNPEVIKRLETLYIPGIKYYEELKMRMWFVKLIDTFFAK